ncbi:alpha/beta fold hydrolase [Tibeticola sp.]|uniref:alpha/beta fold hydrolase n=1 Tax=Tibeticola sp. TaxID=2005368 RepID=UPI0025ED000E|nr:alpha/beta fold hydrolase [Tibeticola sp.]
MKIKANGIDIEVEDSLCDGDAPTQPALLLITGLGLQLTDWPSAFIDALRAAGYRVLRFDNRDVGLSTHLDTLGVPNLVWAGLQHRLGFTPRAPYTLEDMARDALGVLDACGITRAHVLGMSMGGMIAQRLALLAPQRVASLTSLMSSSGARGLPGPDPRILKALLGRPPSNSREAVTEHLVRLLTAIGSPDFRWPEPELRQRVLASIARSYRPAGTLRQLVAVVADTTRAALLPRITAPTLVIHGKADPLVPYACGEDTARRVPGARLVGIDGMGHDLPPGVVERVLAVLLPHLRAADAAAPRATETPSP